MQSWLSPIITFDPVPSYTVGRVYSGSYIRSVVYTLGHIYGRSFILWVIYGRLCILWVIYTKFMAEIHLQSRIISGVYAWKPVLSYPSLGTTLYTWALYPGEDCAPVHILESDIQQIFQLVPSSFLFSRIRFFIFFYG